MYYNLLFKDSCSLTFEGIINFHDTVLYVLILISLLIIFSLYSLYFRKSLRYYFLDNKVIEIVWTIVPALILLLISVPSLSLLYFIDSPIHSFYRIGRLIKVIGHQWYWRYEYDHLGENFQYDSYMVPLSELSLGGFRLLEVDKPLVVNYNRNILVQGITEDVIHSWCCPSLGVKFDVVPGRLNSFKMVPLSLGTFYGQCSEICGANHRFMPIEVEVVL